ncbi:META domain-containing protein [Flavobacterium flavipallidum]|uniref:META domain-containing protein n=1 Tax=Flavobacterium flavipallidum TaxID=3139140 RepID=A0ABU9HMQ6_9FLAO
MKKHISLGIVSLLLFSCSAIKKDASANQLQEKYWKLIEIRGQKVTAENYLKEPYFIIKTKDNRIVGNGGCNSFSGTYELQKETGRISISPLVATKMACIKPTVENEFFKVLETVDNYTLKYDTLQLNKARMAPMAKFVAVYLK